MRLVTRISLLAASILVSIVLAEALVRLVNPQELILLNRTDIWTPDDVVGWRHRPNLAVTVNTGEGAVSFSTDFRGYRSSAERRPVGQRFALVLGDSFLEALSVPYESTLPAVLERHLREKHQLEFIFDNAAVGGWGPSQYLLEAKRTRKLRKYAVGLVFLYIGNDIVSEHVTSFGSGPAGYRPGIRWPRKLNFTELKKGVLHPINEFLKARSHLFNLLKSRLWATLARVGLTAASFPDSFRIATRQSSSWTTTTHSGYALDSRDPNI